MMKKWFLAALFSLVLAPAQAACTAGALPFNLQNNTIADATQVMADLNQIGTGVAANCAGSGANTDITSLGGLTTPLSAGQGGTWFWVGGTSTGSANAQVVATVTPSTNFSLTQGKCIIFTAGFTNTGATQLNVFSTGLVNIFRQTQSGPQAMTGGEIASGQQHTACYDGTQYELLDSTSQFGGFGPLTNLASAATADLGTVPSHNVNVTGVTTITAFGSAASATFPFYQLTFAGTLTLTQNATSLILPGGASITTAAGDTALALYLGSGNWQVTSYTKATGQALVSPALRSYLAGNTLSGGGSTTLTITAGSATSDDQTTLMSLASTYTKTFASWAVGSGNGGLDTGSIATATWYHVYIIERTDTGVVDVLISTSATSPTMPTNYTKKRRIGSIKTDGTPNIVSFSQNGDEFIWAAVVGEINALTSTTPVTQTLAGVPTGFKLNALLRGEISTAGGTFSILINSLDENAVVPNATLGNVTATTIGGSFALSIRTNTSAQIRYVGASSATFPTIQAVTYGWIDTRGRFN
jgi:hypothetical protein